MSRVSIQVIDYPALRRDYETFITTGKSNMRKPKHGHPWTHSGQFINRVEQTRSHDFANFLATRPKQEAATIRKAELVYLTKRADPRTALGAVERYFQDSMHVVQEGDPVNIFVA
jgi:hypothetical protein